MRVALFYPKNFYASWYALGGYKETLDAMGHDVLDCPFPGNDPSPAQQIRDRYPGAAQLAECDVVLSMFHEYTQPWLEAIYGEEMWFRVMERVPVVGRFDESMDRIDLGLPDRVPKLLKWASHYSWPASQDAEKYGGQFLGFGADTRIFNPLGHGDITINEHGSVEKKYQVAFIGSLYQKREEYLKRVCASLPGGITFNCTGPGGNVCVQDLSGIRGRDSTELLAENYRQIKIFFCLPPLSRLVVAKIAEVTACGTFVMYPRLPWGCRDNMRLWEDKKEIVYYEHGYAGQNAKQIVHYLENEDEREAIATAGRRRTHAEYTLEKMLQKIISLPFGEKKLDAKNFSNVVSFPKEPHLPEEETCKLQT